MAPYSIIIPIYNGAAYVESTLRELGVFFANRSDVQIIFVNDGSTDDTEKALRAAEKTASFPIHILSLEENKGKGYAIRYGFAHIAAVSEYVAFTDVELPYGLEKIEEAIAHMEHDTFCQLVIGDRTKNKEGQYSAYRSFFKRCFRLFLPRPVRHISDTQSGMKVFRIHAAQAIFPRIKTDRWVADVEIILTALRHAFGIYPIPVTIKPQCAVGRGGVLVSRHAWQIMKDLNRVKQYDKQYAYHP